MDHSNTHPRIYRSGGVCSLTRLYGDALADWNQIGQLPKIIDGATETPVKFRPSSAPRCRPFRGSSQVTDSAPPPARPLALEWGAQCDYHPDGEADGREAS
jgi:hypothetical protein